MYLFPTLKVTTQSNHYDDHLDHLGHLLGHLDHPVDHPNHTNLPLPVNNPDHADTLTEYPDDDSDQPDLS